MSLGDIDPQFRLDAEVAPTFVVKNYDIDTGEFQVFYNDGNNPQDNVGGTRGTKGIGVDGWGYREQINAWGNGDGDVRGTLIN